MPIKAGVILEGGVTGTGVRGRVSHQFDSGAPAELPQGTAAGAADKVLQTTLTLADGATNNFDLAGANTDVFGTTVTFVKIKAIRLKSKSTNTTNVTVGNHATAAFVGWFGAATHTLILAPGDEIFLSSPNNGKTVTATTADLLKFVNAAGAAADIEVDIIGTSA